MEYNTLFFLGLGGILGGLGHYIRNVPKEEQSWMSLLKSVFSGLLTALLVPLIAKLPILSKDIQEAYAGIYQGNGKIPDSFSLFSVGILSGLFSDILLNTISKFLGKPKSKVLEQQVMAKQDTTQVAPKPAQVQNPVVALFQEVISLNNTQREKALLQVMSKEEYRSVEALAKRISFGDRAIRRILQRLETQQAIEANKTQEAWKISKDYSL